MSKASTVALTAAAWLCWLLDFAGWAILLGGLSGMQQVRIASWSPPAAEGVP
jgi:hypothetical protein